MSTDDKRARDYREQIRARVDNWAQGREYGPGAWHMDAAEHDVIVLLNQIADLEEEIANLTSEAGEAAAWRGRYNALLEEAEASRPHVIDGGDLSRGVSEGTVALDVNGYPWLCSDGGWWILVKDVVRGRRNELHPILGPYTIIHPQRGNHDHLGEIRSQQ